MRFTKRAFWVGVLLFAGLSGAVSLSSQTLHMLCSFNPEECQFYIDVFEEDTGVTVEFVRLSSGSALARVESEAANPTQSIWFAGTNSSHIVAGQKGLLEPYVSSLDELIPDNVQFKDLENHNWIGIYAGFIAFATNKDFLSQNNLQAPTSWADLLKPEFTGKIALAFPFSSGTSYTVLATLLQLGLNGTTPRSQESVDAGFAFAAQLDAQVGQYLESGSGCITLAGTGEFPICISFAHDIASRIKSQSLSLEMTFPSEGTGSEIGGMALIKGGPETASLARAYYDWALSVRAQNLYATFFRVPLNSKATVGEGVVRAADVVLADFDQNWAGNNRDAFIERWRELTGK
ncbi:MAG TPA: ABC transporter substrate-binding protein [Candidatus Bipolaricaulota bacterium]